MLQRVSMEGINLPRLYIAETMEDVRIAEHNGIPYVRWRHGLDALLKQLLRPTLEKMFPGLNWNKILGKRRKFKSDVVIVSGSERDDEYSIEDFDADEMLEKQFDYDRYQNDLIRDPGDPEEDGIYHRTVDIASSPRDCSGKNSNNSIITDRLNIEDYVGDLSSSVDIDALQSLGMLPKFVGDIADCIKFNLGTGMKWTEGYTKKLGVSLGNFNNKPVLPNLVIIDVSHSIPDGIAATMLTLANTLRSRCNAELIITSKRSGYYPIGAELPSPQALRDYYGRSNESVEFFSIISKYIAGREFGHVISFGDDDWPGDYKRARVHLTNTKVHEVHHYHTCRKSIQTGYAKWAMDCGPDAVHYDNSWCNVMNRNYYMR